MKILEMTNLIAVKSHSSTKLFASCEVCTEVLSAAVAWMRPKLNIQMWEGSFQHDTIFSIVNFLLSK